MDVVDADVVEVAEGRPPVAWAAASSADMDDIGSPAAPPPFRLLPWTGMSRPAARAASINPALLVVEDDFVVRAIGVLRSSMSEELEHIRSSKEPDLALSSTMR